MTTIYRNEPFEQAVSIESGGAALTGLTLVLELLDDAGNRVAGPSSSAVESPSGTYTATLTAAMTAGVSIAKVRRRLYAPSGGFDQRDAKSIPITYRPFEE